MRGKFTNQSNNIVIGLVFVLMIGCLCFAVMPSAVRGFTPKGAGDSLSATDWNALRNDFLAADGSAIANNSMLGNLNMGGSFRVSDAGDPAAGTDGASRQWVLDRISARTGGGWAKIVCGTAGPPAAYWENYLDVIAIRVDTRSSGLSPNFSATPLYFTSLGGIGQHFRVSNAVTIVNPTPTGFTAVLHAFTNNTTNPNYSWGWYINWCGVGL